MDFDAIVIGGSYAGMSAALQLVRARRRVMVIDAGRRRNRFAEHSHGFLTQDGADPAAIAGAARAQLQAYPTLSWHDGEARRAEVRDAGFRVMTADGGRHEAKRLVLAHGVTDTLPEVEGLRERWGRSVFHCPYCHGYELGGGPIGVVAVGEISLHHGLMLPDWGPTIFFVNGSFDPTAEQLAQLAARGTAVERTPIARIGGKADVELADGRVVPLAGIFTASRTCPAGGLADDLGCAMEEGPVGVFISTNAMKETTVPGVFACGDAARAAGSVALSVGDGAMAGAATHASLMFRS
jgi:thioredoxin reductase